MLVWKLLERLGSDIFGSLPDSPGRSALKRALRVRKVWAAALGESLAQELQPGKVEGDQLQVLAASSAWLNEIRFLERRILKALEKAAPGLGLESIRARVASESERQQAAPEAPPPPLRPLDPDEVERIQEMVREIRDPALRERLVRVLEKAAARGDRPET